MPPRLARRSMAVLAAVCVTLLLGSQALGTFHHVMVRHVVCSEHGELIHEGASSALVHIDAPSHRPEGASSDAAVASGESSEHGADHHHCDAVSTPYQPGRAGANIPDGTWILLDAPDGGARSAHSSIAQLALAPKASPPRA